jgi:DNA repair ATPase RecN
MPASAAPRPTPSVRALQALGRQSQVLCVTHLAQIAARADAHFEIVKHVAAGARTRP